MAPTVTIVMYHFVRATSTGRFGRLPALDISRFREQLGYFARHYSPIRLVDVVAAAEHGDSLPPRPLVLTFDDGYRDHAAHAFPVLAERRMPATFFPVSSALIERTLLDVNKIQFVLASAGDVGELVRAIEAAVERAADPRVRSVPEYRQQWWTASRFDPPAVAFVKRMLQHGLPPPLRETLVNDLFRRFVTTDEADFAAALYFGIDDARTMLNGGMEFGAHGDRHVPLTALDRAGQAQEIDGALRVLDVLGMPRSRFLFSYAKGEHNAVSVELLRERGCAAAVTTTVGLATPRRDNLLMLPRLDTTDLPTDRSAPPGPWTDQAS